MKKMIIGTDADGVLTDMWGFYRKYGEKFFRHKLVNPQGYTPAEMFEESKIRQFFFVLRYFYEYCCRLNPRKKAREVCKKLNAQGNEIYVITARKFSTMKNPLGRISKKLFMNWVKGNKFPFKGIFFCSEHNTPLRKFDCCKKISVDVMIEDNPEVSLFLAEKGIKVILFDTPYNHSVENENIIRVYNWDEIYKVICTLKMQ